MTLSVSPIFCLPAFRHSSVAGHDLWTLHQPHKTRQIWGTGQLFGQVVMKIKDSENLPAVAKVHPLLSVFCGANQVVLFQNRSLTTNC
jgi:hypothetical protein